MIDAPLIVVISVMVFVYGLVSQLLERTAITAPIVFVSVGVLLGPAGVSLLHIDLDAAIVRIVAELTLIIILFVEASHIGPRRKRTGSPRWSEVYGAPRSRRGSCGRPNRADRYG